LGNGFFFDMVPLRGSQQGIEQGQIRGFHDHVRGSGEFRALVGQGDHGRRGQRHVAREQNPQSILHGRLALAGRVLKDSQVFLGPRPFALFLAEPVVGHAEAAGREQILAVAILGKRSRLADQRVDDVPVLHLVLVPPDQSRQRVHTVVRVPHLDPIGEESGLDRFADEPTVHRVRVAVDVDEAARIDPAWHAKSPVDSLGRQWSQRGSIRIEARTTFRVPRGRLRVQERGVLLAAREVPAAPQQKGLIDGTLEVPVSRLVVPVLVRLPHVDPLARHPVVVQQIPIPLLEFPLRRQVVDGRTQTVAAVASRNTAEFPDRVLESVRQRLERFRGTHRHRFPIRVRQHEVVDEVVERLTLNGDGQIIHGREVGTGEIAGVMDLREHRLAARSERGPPVSHLSLESPPVARVELTGILRLHPREERFGLEPGLGRQLRGDGCPNGLERIAASAIGPGFLGGAGQGPRRAVLAGGFLVHACPPGGLGQWPPRFEIAKQLANLTIRDHATPPNRRWERAVPSPFAKRELAKPGILIVAGREM
jgi:hypothetical protein